MSPSVGRRFGGAIQKMEYTRLVSVWFQRTIGLVTVVAVVGSPSVVAACAALCAPGVVDGADNVAHHGGHPSHDERAPAAEREEPTHHHSLSGNEVSRVQRLGMNAPDRDCCTLAWASARLKEATFRADMGFHHLADVPTHGPALESAFSLTAGPGFVSDIPPPSPPRAPLVLLI